MAFKCDSAQNMANINDLQMEQYSGPLVLGMLQEFAREVKRSLWLAGGRKKEKKRNADRIYVSSSINVRSKERCRQKHKIY